MEVAMKKTVKTAESARPAKTQGERPDFPIETGVPRPGQSSAYAYQKYPWRGLEVSESFLVPVTVAGKGRAAEMEMRRRLSGMKAVADYQVFFASPKRFECHIVEGGIRVWRIK
jgi:hypothetical protein|tara:strand:+ start:977 stop:1318 length:342 start_codon:yes stop_codon:yes gene_type:complete